VSESIPLQFPAGTPSGTYTVLGKLSEIKVNDLDCTWLVEAQYPQYMSRPVPDGTVSYVAFGGGGGTPRPPHHYLSLDVLGNTQQWQVQADGKLLQPIEFSSQDGKINLHLNKDTFCLDRLGDPLDCISVTRETEPPPYSGGFVVNAYKLEPNGAKFEPYLELILAYDKGKLPSGAREDSLCIAYYDHGAQQWISLESKVDPEASVVIAKVKHFTTFAIIGKMVPSVPASTPSFVVTNMNITPSQIEVGQTVTISAEVRNNGGSEGEYPLNLMINGVWHDSRDITLAPGESRVVTYEMSGEEAGDYNVSLDGQSGKFTVVSVPSYSWLSRHWIAIAIIILLFIFWL
jgi:hypothetical protein